jgi:hypothetical protein
LPSTARVNRQSRQPIQLRLQQRQLFSKRQAKRQLVDALYCPAVRIAAQHSQN